MFRPLEQPRVSNSNPDLSFRTLTSGMNHEFSASSRSHSLAFSPGAYVSHCWEKTEAAGWVLNYYLNEGKRIRTREINTRVTVDAARVSNTNPTSLLAHSCRGNDS